MLPAHTTSPPYTCPHNKYPLCCCEAPLCLLNLTHVLRTHTHFIESGAARYNPVDTALTSSNEAPPHSLFGGFLIHISRLRSPYIGSCLMLLWRRVQACDGPAKHFQGSTRELQKHPPRTFKGPTLLSSKRDLVATAGSKLTQMSIFGRNNVCPAKISVL